MLKTIEQRAARTIGSPRSLHVCDTSRVEEFEPVRVVITHPAGEQQASLKSDHPQ